MSSLEKIWIIKDRQWLCMDSDRPYAVTILTHEGGKPPLEQSIVQLLTDFFLCARVRLHTYVIASDLENSSDKRNGAHAHLTLVDSDLHKKECVQETNDIPRNQVSEVMFLQCHGVPRNKQKMRPFAGLQFKCPRNKVTESLEKQVVWTWTPPIVMPKVNLHDIVGKTRLAIVLACHGDQVIEDYLKAVGDKPFPDMLIFNLTTIYNPTIEILTSLLVNIMDSELVSRVPQVSHDGTICKCNYEDGVVYEVVRAAIMRIFQILKVFDGDPRGFWGFLQSVQCISDTRIQKQRQQLVYPKRYDVNDFPNFRTAASVSTYTVAMHPEKIYFELKSMQLVSRGENRAVVREDWTTVAPIEVADSGDVDKYLREYQQQRQTAYMPAPLTPDLDSQLTRTESDNEDLRRLLRKLQRHL